MMHTAEFSLPQIFEYLGEIEREFEHALTFLSGAQVGSNDEKIEVKNLVTHSL